MLVPANRMKKKIHLESIENDCKLLESYTQKYFRSENTKSYQVRHSTFNITHAKVFGRLQKSINTNHRWTQFSQMFFVIACLTQQNSKLQLLLDKNICLFVLIDFSWLLFCLACSHLNQMLNHQTDFHSIINLPVVNVLLHILVLHRRLEFF